jgi:hypothetical protein
VAVSTKKGLLPIHRSVAEASPKISRKQQYFLLLMTPRESRGEYFRFEWDVWVLNEMLLL